MRVSKKTTMKVVMKNIFLKLLFNILKIYKTFFTWKSKNWKKKNKKKLVVNLHDKKEYIIHTRNLKESLTNGLVFKKIHRVV